MRQTRGQSVFYVLPQTTFLWEEIQNLYTFLGTIICQVQFLTSEENRQKISPWRTLYQGCGWGSD